MAPDLDPYAVLGVTPQATQDEINRAYRRLVRRHHPDTRPEDPAPADSPATLEQVLAAYAILRDPSRRAEYDRRHAPRTARRTPPTVRHVDPDSRTEFTIRVGPVRYHGPAR
jgi:curved DNA-binding protein CbpA